MLKDASSFHPPEPFLGNALKRVVVDMVTGQREIARLMEQAKEKYGPLPEGTPIKFGQGDDIVELPYTDPYISNANANFVEECGLAVAQALDGQASLEAQEALLLEEMNSVLDMSVFSNVHPSQAGCFITTITELFKEYPKADEPMSRALLSTRNTIDYYARIAYDSNECIENLLVMMQEKEGTPETQMMRTPHSLAWKRARQKRPLSIQGDGEFLPDHSAIHSAAREIVLALTEPYNSALPAVLNVNIMGLIMRCTEEVAEDVLLAHRSLRHVRYDNDNAPWDARELLADPRILDRVREVLTELFECYPNAGESVEQSIEASLGLEELLAQQRTQHAQHGRGGR